VEGCGLAVTCAVAEKSDDVSRAMSVRRKTKFAVPFGCQMGVAEKAPCRPVTKTASAE
jgi:hypothetical protein